MTTKELFNGQTVIVLNQDDPAPWGNTSFETQIAIVDAINELSQNSDGALIADVKAKLTKEIARSTEIDTQLSQALNTETSARVSGDNGLQSQISLINASITEINTALAGKQGALTAGANITIANNVISAQTGGGNGGECVCKKTERYVCSRNTAMGFAPGLSDIVFGVGTSTVDNAQGPRGVMNIVPRFPVRAARLRIYSTQATAGNAPSIQFQSRLVNGSWQTHAGTNFTALNDNEAQYDFSISQFQYPADAVFRILLQNIGIGAAGVITTELTLSEEENPVW